MPTSTPRPRRFGPVAAGVRRILVRLTLAFALGVLLGVAPGRSLGGEEAAPRFIEKSFSLGK